MTVGPMRSFSFLLKAYELGSSEAEGAVPIWDVGAALGIEETEAESLASDLQEMNLIYYSSLAGDIALTSFGVSEIVLARSLPDQATTHFPPLALMSDQMMLPLTARAELPVTDQLDTRLRKVDHTDAVDSFSSEVHVLATQLEAFKHDLCGSESAVHLDRRIDELDNALGECGHWSKELLSELEEIQLELTL